MNGPSFNTRYQWSETTPSLGDVRLDFSFGYWRFYSYPLRGQMITKHFVDLPSHPPSARDLSSLPGERQEPVWILPHPVKEMLPTLEFGRSLFRYVPNRYPRYYIELSGTFEQYLQRFSRKRRHELRRKMRKFARTGSTFFREYRSPQEIRAFYDPALTVSRQSFQKRIGHGLPEDPEFLTKLVRRAEQGKIRGYLLFHDGHPAAFALCHVNGDCLTGELCGYDPSLSQLSPGIALMGYIVERLFEEQQFRMLDLGPGDADYKAFFATGSVPCADVYYFPRSLKNIALVIAHWTTAVLWQWTTRILDVLRVKDSLKKLARNGWKKPVPVSSTELTKC